MPKGFLKYKKTPFGGISSVVTDSKKEKKNSSNFCLSPPFTVNYSKDLFYSPGGSITLRSVSACVSQRAFALSTSLYSLF